jgi:hypothetical protein
MEVTRGREPALTAAHDPSGSTSDRRSTHASRVEEHDGLSAAFDRLDAVANSKVDAGVAAIQEEAQALVDWQTTKATLRSAVIAAFNEAEQHPALSAGTQEGDNLVEITVALKSDRDRKAVCTFHRATNGIEVENLVRGTRLGGGYFPANKVTTELVRGQIQMALLKLAE